MLFQGDVLDEALDELGQRFELWDSFAAKQPASGAMAAPPARQTTAVEERTIQPRDSAAIGWWRERRGEHN